MTDPREQRRRYLAAYNTTMVDIWRDAVRKLGIFDTGTLASAPADTTPVRMNADVTEAEITHKVRLYGLFVNFGVGRNTPIGNPGDIGRDNPRKRRRWFSPKLWSSYNRLSDFFAESIGQDAVNSICNALSRRNATTLT